MLQLLVCALATVWSEDAQLQVGVGSPLMKIVRPFDEAFFVVSLSGSAGGHPNNVRRLETFFARLRDSCGIRGFAAPNVTHCPGVVKKRGFGVTASFSKCAERAHMSGAEHLWFFEDDAVLANTTSGNFCSRAYRRALIEKSPSDVYMLLLGGHAFRRSAGQRVPNYRALGSSFGLYGFHMHRRTLLSFKADLDVLGNSRAGMVSPDVAIHGWARKRNQTIYSTVPLLVWHSRAWSNTWGRFRDEIKEGSPKFCCGSAQREHIFNGIIAGLLLEGRVPPGSLIDAGANDGSWSCLMAAVAPDRLVHAIDPLRSNVAHLQRTSSCANVRPAHHGLGASATRLDPGEKFANLPAGHQMQGGGQLSSVPAGSGSGAAFDVYTVDDLFARNYSGETLGLAHWDVQGMAMAVIQGARQTILRDRPLFTVELNVHADVSYTQALFGLLSQLRYDAYLVEEVCGDRVDCRNLIAFPRERTPLFRGSPTLNMVTASRKLFAVDSSSIVEHAYPCCQPGGACCPRRYGCCTKEAVGPWLVRRRKEYFENATNRGREFKVHTGPQRDPTLFSHLAVWWQNRYTWPGPQPGTILDIGSIY